MSSGARVYRNSNQAIPHGEPTALIFNKVRWDTDNYFSLHEPTRLTVSESGIYLIQAMVIWEDYEGGVRQLTLKVGNGNVIATDRTKDITGWSAFNTATTVWALEAGEYVEAYAFYWVPMVIQGELGVRRAAHWDSPEFLIQKM